MPLEIRAMRHLIALGECRNFARAAHQLHITQPALSRSIQAVESAIGARLFDRGRQGVTPTDAGRLLLDLVRPIVNESEEADRQLRHMLDSQTGRIRIGAGPYPADISVGQAVGILTRQRPGIRVDLAVDDWPDVVRSLLNGDLDVAIAEIGDIEHDERLQVEPLPRHRAVMFVRKGHALTRRRGISLEDVSEYPLACSELPRRLEELYRRRRAKLRRERTTGEMMPDIHVDTFSLVSKVVEYGDAVGVAIRSQIRAQLRTGRFAILPLKPPWLVSNYGILRLAGRTPSPLAVEFMRILREVEDGIDPE